MNELHHDDSHDWLAWQAFRYVAGEMDSREQEYFAAILNDDQAAREAVAAAYELAQASAMALAERPSPAAHRSRPARIVRWLWLAAGTAACLVVAVGVARQNMPQRAVASLQTDALAAQWSEVRQQQGDNVPWPAVRDASDDLLAFDEWSRAENLDVSETAPLSAPEWMLAAVSVQDIYDDMPSEMERGSEASQEQ